MIIHLVISLLHLIYFSYNAGIPCLVTMVSDNLPVKGEFKRKSMKLEQMNQDQRIMARLYQFTEMKSSWNVQTHGNIELSIIYTISVIIIDLPNIDCIILY